MIAQKRSYFALGCFVGVFAAIPATLVLVSFDVWSNDGFWGALFGGGGAVAAQIIFIYYDRGQRKKEESERRLSKLYSIMSKLSSIEVDLKNSEEVYSTVAGEGNNFPSSNAEASLSKFLPSLLDLSKLSDEEREIILLSRSNLAVESFLELERHANIMRALQKQAELFFANFAELRLRGLNDKDYVSRIEAMKRKFLGVVPEIQHEIEVCKIHAEDLKYEIQRVFTLDYKRDVNFTVQRQTN